MASFLVCDKTSTISQSSSNAKVRGQILRSEGKVNFVKFFDITHECFDIVASILVCDKASTISWPGSNTKVIGQILRS